MSQEAPRLQCGARGRNVRLPVPSMVCWISPVALGSDAFLIICDGRSSTGLPVSVPLIVRPSRVESVHAPHLDQPFNTEVAMLTIVTVSIVASCMFYAFVTAEANAQRRPV